MTIEEIIKLITEWITEKQTGSIQLNFFKGGISNANLTMSISGEKRLKDMKTREYIAYMRKNRKEDGKVI